MPPAGEGGELPLYTEIVGGVGDVGDVGEGRGRGGMVPEFQDVHAPYAAVSVPVSDMQSGHAESGYRRGGEEGGLADWGVEKAEVRRSGTKVVGLRSLRRRLKGLDGMR